MYEHVSSQHVRLVELHVTLCAGVVLGRSVASLVLIQSVDVVELLTADIAVVGTMHVHVALEDRRLAASHRAQFAGVDRFAVLVLNYLRVPQRQSTFYNGRIHTAV